MGIGEASGVSGDAPLASPAGNVNGALIMSTILFTVPSFYNLLSGSHVERIDTFLRRISRCGYNNNLFVFRDIVNYIDATLFKKIVRSTHCRHHLFPPIKPHLWDLHVVCSNSCDFILIYFVLLPYVYTYALAALVCLVEKVYLLKFVLYALHCTIGNQ